jgi:PQQ-dependent catabolism-associated CXXCW motif protein
MKALAAVICVIAAHAAWGAPYADEERDWGLVATRDLKQPPYHAPTPREVPGARTITTDALKALLASSEPPLLLDVAAGERHVSLKGATWLPNAGRGLHYFDNVQADTADRLAGMTARNKARAMVFFCVNAECWLSYNASLRAAALGYSNVYWYRGGIEAWLEAGLPTENLADPAR